MAWQSETDRLDMERTIISIPQHYNETQVVVSIALFVAFLDKRQESLTVNKKSTIMNNNNANDLRVECEGVLLEERRSVSTAFGGNN
jgi:hypothetical protein